MYSRRPRGAHSYGHNNNIMMIMKVIAMIMSIITEILITKMKMVIGKNNNKGYHFKKPNDMDTRKKRG